MEEDGVDDTTPWVITTFSNRPRWSPATNLANIVVSNPVTQPRGDNSMFRFPPPPFSFYLPFFLLFYFVTYSPMIIILTTLQFRYYHYTLDKI